MNYVYNRMAAIIFSGGDTFSVRTEASEASCYLFFAFFFKQYGLRETRDQSEYFASIPESGPKWQHIWRNHGAMSRCILTLSIFLFTRVFSSQTSEWNTSDLVPCGNIATFAYPQESFV